MCFREELDSNYNDDKVTFFFNKGCYPLTQVVRKKMINIILTAVPLEINSKFTNIYHSLSTKPFTTNIFYVQIITRTTTHNWNFARDTERQNLNISHAVK